MIRTWSRAAALSFAPALALACPMHDAQATADAAPVILTGGMTLAHDAGHGHAHGDAAPAAGTASVGPVSVEGAFARAAAAPGGASAAYMNLSIAAGADRLVAAASPAAAKVELHTHTLDAQGVARMTRVEGIEVVAGSPTELRPGGLHVMLMGLSAPLAEGDAIDLTLTFEKAGAVSLTVPVRAVGGHGHGVSG